MKDKITIGDVAYEIKREYIGSQTLRTVIAENLMLVISPSENFDNAKSCEV